MSGGSDKNPLKSIYGVQGILTQGTNGSPDYDKDYYYCYNLYYYYENNYNNFYIINIIIFDIVHSAPTTDQGRGCRGLVTTYCGITPCHQRDQDASHQSKS